MAEQAYYHQTENIYAFPSSNSVDKGKLTEETNMTNIVTRITRKAYTITKADYALSIAGDGKSINISSGMANINGYDIQSDTSINIGAPSTAGTWQIGMRVTRDGTGLMRGDVPDGNITYFEGVWFGFFEIGYGEDDRDFFGLGTVDWDGNEFSNLEENPDKDMKIDASEIKVIVKGPKPPYSVETLQDYVDKMSYRYVSKYGDEEYGELTFKFDRADETIVDKYGIQIDLLDTTDKASHIIVKPHDNNAVYDINKFLSLDSRNLTNGDIQNTMYMGQAYVQTTQALSQYQSIPSMLLSSQALIRIYGLGNVRTYASVDNTAMYSLMTPTNFSLGLNSNVETHKLWADPTTQTSNFQMQKLLMSVDPNGETWFRESNTGIINVDHTLNATQKLQAGNNIVIGPNTDTTTSTFTQMFANSWYQHRLATGVINTVGTYGHWSTLGMGVTTSLTTNSTPVINTNHYTFLQHNRLTINTPNSDYAGGIYFTGSGTGNNVTITHAYNQPLLVLNGSLSVTNGDINAPGSTANLGRVYNAVYNDMAELRKKDVTQDFEVGCLVSKDKQSDNYVLATKENKKLVVGVVSDSYGYIMGGKEDKTLTENLEDHVAIGISGHLKIKVKGKLKAGDLITVSNVDGVGKKASLFSKSCVVGKALENKTDIDIGYVDAELMLR